MLKVIDECLDKEMSLQECRDKVASSMSKGKGKTAKKGKKKGKATRKKRGKKGRK